MGDAPKEPKKEEKQEINGSVSWFENRKKDIFQLGAFLSVIYACSYIPKQVLENGVPLYLAVLQTLFGCFILAYLFFAIWDAYKQRFGPRE